MDFTWKRQEIRWKKRTGLSLTNKNSEVDFTLICLKLGRSLIKRKEPDYWDEHSLKALQIVKKWTLKDNWKSNRYKRINILKNKSCSIIKWSFSKNNWWISKVIEIAWVFGFQISEFFERIKNYSYQRNCLNISKTTGYQ